MSERTPSAHSMTVETTDRENLATKVFQLEKWQADAVKVISHLEGERNEAVANEKAARAEIARLGADIDRLTVQRNETQHQLNICREDLANADRTARVTKAALDAAIEAV